MTFQFKKIRTAQHAQIIMAKTHVLLLNYFIFIRFIHIDIAVSISLEYTEKFKKISTTRPT